MFLNEQETRKVLDTLNGKIPEDAVLKDMKAFFKEKFSIEILDYIADRAKNGRKRLMFFVWGIESTWPFIGSSERKKENKIKEAFSRSCKEHGLNSEYFDPDSYFAIVSDFKPDVEKLLMTRENMKKISELLKKHPEVNSHRISDSTVFVFYNSDKDIKTYGDSGLTKQIYDEVCDLLSSMVNLEGLGSRKIGDVRFSSMETFVMKYNSNFHFFWLDN